VANLPVCLVFRRHNTEMEEMAEFVYKKGRESLYFYLAPKTLQCDAAMLQNMVSKMQIASHHCCSAVQ
jgi:hypothetical protein